MDSQAIALFIAAGGLVLGLARLIISILSYRLDARRQQKTHRDLGERRKTSIDQ